MRIVLDTNVLVSALLVQGSVPDQVLGTIIAGHVHTLVDGRILREYRTVLARPEFAFDTASVDDVMTLFERSEWIVAVPLGLPLSDPTDAPFLEVAIAGGADALVTGNAKDYRISGKPLELDVLTPREFLTRLAGR